MKRSKLINEGSVQRRAARLNRAGAPLGPAERLAQRYSQTRSGLRHITNIKDPFTGQHSDPVTARQRQDPEHMDRERERDARELNIKRSPSRVHDFSSGIRHIETGADPEPKQKPPTRPLPDQPARPSSRRLQTQSSRRHAVPLGLEHGSGSANLVERIVGIGNPILSPAIKLATHRLSGEQNQDRRDKIVSRIGGLVKGVRHYENLPRHERVVRETQPATIQRSGLSDAQKAVGSTIMARKIAADRTRRLAGRTPVLSHEELQRTPLLSEFVSAGNVGPNPFMRPDLIGKTIAGGFPIKGATTTANLGLRSSPSGFPVFPVRILSDGKKKKKSKKK